MTAKFEYQTSLFKCVQDLLSCLTIALPFIVITIRAQPYNFECNFGSMAMTNEFGVNIPQTCFQSIGHRRCFYTFAPKCVKNTSYAIPLLYDIHDQGSCPVVFAQQSGWFEKASRECFIVVWPTGNNQESISDFPCWQVPGGLVFSGDQETQPCCCRKHGYFLAPEDTNDIEFLRQIAVRVVRDLTINDGINIDTKRIYMTGHGNGCTMAMTMAAVHSDVVAAVCCMAGSVLTPPSPYYIPTPVWNILGEEDTIFPYEGFFQPDFGLVTPDAYDAFQALSEWNGCLLEDEEQPVLEYIPSMNIEIGNNITQKATLRTDRATHCRNGATVELVTISTAGHNLYYNDLSKINVGANSFTNFPWFSAKSSIDATSMAWHFCKAHSRDQEPALTTKIITKRTIIDSSSGGGRRAVSLGFSILSLAYCCFLVL
mmetsp:Transcript_22519/g.34187  ORF Transcript_22519/g.34187 Transcript_22519/m.34187 type:complete len:428 (-) Transcript_22519:128-1411(-)